MTKLNLLCVTLVLACVSMLHAEVSLPKVMGSHMVLQRDKPLHVWGSGAASEAVTVELHGGHATTTVDELGRWSVYLPAQPAGGPYTLTVRGANTITLEDVMLGDLWFASGQSNMEMPLVGFGADTPVKDSAKEIAAANHPEIRLMSVMRKGASYPLEDVIEATPWSRCTPETAKNFSAVAYFFGRAIQQKEKVAIGLIDSTWGGTPADAWTSMDGLSADAGLMPVFSAWASMIGKETDGVRMDEAEAEAKAKGLTPPARGWHPQLISYQPAALYNAMVAPFTPLPVRGVIWYQGESNSALNRAPLYGRLFPAMIEDWRKHWGDEEMPFLFVQLAGFTSTPQEDWPTIREAQRQALRLRNTGMAVTIDIGSEHNVHPPDKETVGERLALKARAISYKEAVVASGPMFLRATPADGALMVDFSGAAGLMARGGAVKGVEVAGADGVFVAADAAIVGERLEVRGVASPRYVRYAWKNFPEANLYNKEGLPASPFTSQ